MYQVGLGMYQVGLGFDWNYCLVFFILPYWLCFHFVFVGFMVLKMMDLIEEEYFKLQKIMGFVGIGSIMNHFSGNGKFMIFFFL